MTASTAVLGPGFLLQKGDGGSPEAFTTIAEVQDIKGPAGATTIVDITNQSSPNHFKEIAPTLLEGGQVTFDCIFVPQDATQNGTTGLLADWKNRTLRNFQLICPDSRSTTLTFAAYVTKLDNSFPFANVAKTSVTLDISGPYTQS